MDSLKNDRNALQAMCVQLKSSKRWALHRRIAQRIINLIDHLSTLPTTPSSYTNEYLGLVKNVCAYLSSELSGIAPTTRSDPCAGFLNVMAHFHESALRCGQFNRQIRLLLSCWYSSAAIDGHCLPRHEDLEDYLLAHHASLSYAIDGLGEVLASPNLARVYLPLSSRGTIAQVLVQEPSLLPYSLCAYLTTSGHTRGLMQTEAAAVHGIMNAMEGPLAALRHRLLKPDPHQTYQALAPFISPPLLLPPAAVSLSYGTTIPTSRNEHNREGCFRDAPQRSKGSRQLARHHKLLHRHAIPFNIVMVRSVKSGGNDAAQRGVVLEPKESRSPTTAWQM